MPERPELEAFKRRAERILLKKGKGKALVRIKGRLCLVPRTYAIGTKQKAYQTITLDGSRMDPRCEPPNPDYASLRNKHDLMSAKRNKCTHLVDRPLQEGPVIIAVRGKCLAIAAGHHLALISFGLEAGLYTMPRDDFDLILEGDCPGPNPNKSKANKLRSFKFPDHLIEPGTGTTHTVNIFCAFLTQTHAIVITDFSRLVRLHIISRTAPWTPEDLEVGSHEWKSTIWKPFTDGPDWILETDDAYAELDAWREQVIASKCLTSIVEVIASKDTRAFGGFGRHLANDFLFEVAIHPGLSGSAVCNDPSLWERLRGGIHEYMLVWVSKGYTKYCATASNSLNTFAFNTWSDIVYLRQFTKVYYKKQVLLSADLYNLYVRLGLLDPTHTIGEEYPSSSYQLSERGRYVDVHLFDIGGEEAFTIITAKPPSEHKWLLISESYWTDIRAMGNSTTVGPASFREPMQNKPKNIGTVNRVGRPRKIRTGLQGRPRSSNPKAARRKLPKCTSSYKKLLLGSNTTLAGTPVLAISGPPSPIKTRAARRKTVD